MHLLSIHPQIASGSNNKVKFSFEILKSIDCIEFRRNSVEIMQNSQLCRVAERRWECKQNKNTREKTLPNRGIHKSKTAWENLNKTTKKKVNKTFAIQIQRFDFQALFENGGLWMAFKLDHWAWYFYYSMSSSFALIWKKKIKQMQTI